MVRLLVGFLLLLSAVGGIENGNGPLYVSFFVLLFALFLMASGAYSMREK